MSENEGRNLEAKIAARYNRSIAKKKNITFNIDEELLERLDVIVAHFNEKEGDSTRNGIIEEAVLGYVESAEDFFEKQNLNEDMQNEVDGFYDTAVYPATNKNFTKVFIGEHKWYYVRMAEFRIPSVQYVALYRGAPISAITHYAEVISIGDVNEDNKRLILLKEPVTLPNSVKLGNLHVNNVRKLFYTKLEDLKQVSTVEELLNLK